jgi:Fe-S cluster assembly scaffold protein SufB
MNQLAEKYIKEIDLKIDFSRFGEIEKAENTLESMDKLILEDDEKSSLKAVGVNLFDDSEAGNFLMYGNDVYTSLSRISGVEIFPLKKALLLYPDIKDKYYFKAIDKEQDEFTKTVFEKEQNGYFIRVKKNVMAEAPLHTALFMHKEMSTMLTCI